MSLTLKSLLSLKIKRSLKEVEMDIQQTKNESNINNLIIFMLLGTSRNIIFLYYLLNIAKILLEKKSLNLSNY